MPTPLALPGEPPPVGSSSRFDRVSASIRVMRVMLVFLSLLLHGFSCKP
ncbi:hypothetical protein [Polyangium fumosum]|nr:hypothetical protein [Polyangium fumosum]